MGIPERLKKVAKEIAIEYQFLINKIRMCENKHIKIINKVKNTIIHYGSINDNCIKLCGINISEIHEDNHIWSYEIKHVTCLDCLKKYKEENNNGDSRKIFKKS